VKINNKIYPLTLSLLLFSACSTKNIEQETKEHNKTINYTYFEIDDSNNTKEEITQVTYDELQGDFQGNYQLIDFIDMMVNTHGFDRKELNRIFSQAQNHNYIPLTRTDCTSTIIHRPLGKWDRYKSCFIYDSNIQRGIEFWNKYSDVLERAEQQYGVPARYIVGIIGIETAYGVNFGKHRVIDVLTTKAMLGERRSSFYTDELENFLVITRDIGLDPTETMGSTSGALGYGQFMPSSYIRFAVDFNNDGKTDLWNAEDAIGSIANYFAKNGWNSSIQEVAVRAKYKGNRFKKLKTGYKTKYSQYKLKRKYKIKSRSKMHYRGPVSLVKLNRASYDELWFGTHNFRVITTYNHSALYGMAVYQLAEKINKERG
jgi:membrane-bound lytic murein transglycosylase B